MRVAVLYEQSGLVRDTFAMLGHDALSVDLRPSARPGQHVQCDVLKWLRSSEARGIDRAIAHPTCTWVAGSGTHWNYRIPGRHACTLFQLDHVRKLIALLDDVAEGWAMENPVGLISTQIMPATQYIQPHWFGDDASKKTGLWLRRLRPLVATERVPGRLVEWPRGSGKFVERWSNQTDSGQNKLGPSDDRWSIRSETYPGIAAAFGVQWGL